MSAFYKGIIILWTSLLNEAEVMYFHKEVVHEP